jgi:hypothetical protein
MKIEEKILNAESYWSYANHNNPELSPFAIENNIQYYQSLNFLGQADFSDSNNIQSHVPAITLLNNLLTSGSDMLYLACGFGLGIKIFELEGFNVEGIDINSRYVDFCKKHGLNVKQGNAITLDNIDKKYDVIISRDFLRRDYHNENYFIVLNESLNNQYEHLNDSGIAITYSILFDAASSNIALSQRINKQELYAHKFREFQQYMIKYNMANIRQYVDVFIK